MATNPTVERSAVLSPCGLYRYSLSRIWDRLTPPVLFIMLNPSTADAEQDDPTIRRCMGFAQRWGAGGVRVVNLFAWRATRPADLKRAHYLQASIVGDPRGYPIVGPNDSALISMAADAGRIIAAWGAWPGPFDRTHQVAGLLDGRHVEALALTSKGAPRHPLYVRGDVEPVTYWGQP